MSTDGELYERDPEAWNAYLAEGNAKQARNRVSADAIVRDPSGRILLVDPTYSARGPETTGSNRHQPGNWSPWYWVLFLVDCLDYQGLCHAQEKYADSSPDRDEPTTTRMEKAH